MNCFLHLLTQKNHRKTARELTTFQPFPLELKTDSGTITSNRKSLTTSPSNENEDRLQNLKSNLDQCKRKFGDLRTKIHDWVVTRILKLQNLFRDTMKLVFLGATCILIQPQHSLLQYKIEFNTCQKVSIVASQQLDEKIWILAL